MFDTLWQDLRYSVRALAQAPMFTLVAVVSLAIGIAGSTTIFSLADALLLRALPGVSDPDRLVDVGRNYPDGSGFDNLSYLNYADLRDRNTVFEGLAGYRLQPQPLGLGSEAGVNAVNGALVTAEYFSVLGVPMALGRAFTREEDQPGRAQPVAVLAHHLWRNRFGADTHIVGRTIRLNGQPVTVIGVATDRFTGHTILQADVWVPFTLRTTLTGSMDTLFTERGNSSMLAIARLRPGISIGQARAEVERIGLDLRREYPQANRERGFALAPSRPAPGQAAQMAAVFLGILFALVGLILVIACANVAGMMLARGAGRARDVAVRLALGATRPRVVRQLVMESVLVAAGGAVAGIGAAVALVRLLDTLVPAVPIGALAVTFRVDWRVMLFSVALAFVVGILTGLVPALQAARTALSHTMKADAQAGSRPQRLRRVFVGAQVAVSVLLIVCALLLVQSLRNAHRIDPGFDPAGVDAAELNLTLGGYTDPERGLEFSERLLASIIALPGVESAASSIVLPLTGSGHGLGSLRRSDRAEADRASFLRNVDWDVISPDYFETMRIPLLRGRAFTSRDRAGAPDVAIVNDTFARQVWPGEDPIGKTLVQGQGPVTRRLLVVGVARDSKHRSLGEAPLPFIYVPMAQQYQPRQWVLARTTGPSVAPQLAAVLRDMDPHLPFVQVTTLADAAVLGLLPARLAAAVATSAGAIGLLLAAIGLYGVIAFSVAQRTREIGVRMALGATTRAVMHLVGRQALGVAGAGAVAGLLVAALAAQLLRVLLYGIAPLDPLSFTAAAALMGVVVLAAGTVPAWRAVNVNPVDALRTE